MDRRSLCDGIARAIMAVSAFFTVAILAALLVAVFVKGLPALTIDMVTMTPKGGYYIGRSGGVLNAILGSLALGAGATALALSVSLPIVSYLHLYLKRRSGLALAVRFFLDVLWGIPSIVYGSFGFALMAFFGLKASLLAGIIIVAILIAPIMTRSMDEAFRMIPCELQEACLALGSTRFETATRIIFRQAVPGIVTAVLIAFGRGIGDAAAVLFTAGFTDSIPYSLFKPVATLPLAIFFQLGTPFPEVQQRGYASAVILTLIVLLVSIASRIFSQRFQKNVER